MYGITLDREGVLWFTTDRGVSSFDGADWKNRTAENGLMSNSTRAIAVDDLNRKWICYDDKTFAGVTCFDGRMFLTYTKSDGLRSDKVTSATSGGDGKVWFCTDRGLARFDGISWTNYPAGDRLFSASIKCVTETPDGAIWFATARGLSRYENGNWQTSMMEDGFPADLIVSVAADAGGKIWCVSDTTVVSFDGNRCIGYPVYVAGSVRGIKKVMVDGQNRVWTNPTWCGFTDSGYSDYEMYCLENSEWKRLSFRYPAGTVSPLKFITDNNHTVWIAGSGGLYQRAETQMKPYTIINNPPGSSIFETITVDTMNTMWFVSEGLVFSFDGTIWRNHTSEIYQLALSLSHPVYLSSIVINRNNVKWIPCRPNGIFAYNGKSWTLHLTGDGIDLSMFIDLPVHTKDLQNVLWFSSSTKGAISFDGQWWRQYTVADGLASPFIYSMAVDSNNVKWFGSNKGLTSFDGSVWHTHSLKDSLGIEAVFGLAAGNDGTVWVKAGYGFGRYKAGVWKFFKPQGVGVGGVFLVDNRNVFWTTFTWKKVSNALLSCNGDSITYYPLSGIWGIGKDLNGVIWISSRDGVYSLDNRPGIAPNDRPRPLTLLQNYPNPFNMETNISFELFSWGKVNLEIYNIMGQKVRTLVSDTLGAGRNSFLWDGTDDRGKKVSSGVYLYRVSKEGAVAKDKMLFLK